MLQSFNKLLTPCYIVSPVVDRNVMYALDCGQVYPPSGNFIIIRRNDTLTSPSSQIRLKSINSITGIKCIQSRIVLMKLVRWFVKGNVNCKMETINDEATRNIAISVWLKILLPLYFKFYSHIIHMSRFLSFIMKTTNKTDTNLII